MNEVEINKARSVYYSLFSHFFVYSADVNRYLEMIRILNILKENPLDAESGEAINRLQGALDATSNVKLVSEYDDIFHNPETSTIRTTASFYDELVECGKKRLQMLDFLAKTKIRRDEKTFTEYEDSVGFIFTLMSELLELVSNGEENYKTLQHCIFADVLNEFIDEFAKNLYEHESAVLFKDIVIVLNSFLELERLYLEVSKPKAKPAAEVALVACDTKEEISEEEKQRRARNKAMKAMGPKQDIDPNDIAYDVETEI